MIDHLPPPLILEILSRLDDSLALTRCRLASRSLNSVAGEVRSVNLHCTLFRYLTSRSPHSSLTPFKSIFLGLVSGSDLVESVSVGVDRSLRNVSFEDVDESDDLWLTDGRFVREWLPVVAGRLRSVSVSDFWIQACWRQSELLALVSEYCHSLLELEVKNAWLSVDGLKPMPMLTCLTLEYIRLDDEDLNTVNDCFPSLERLNLIGVGGLKEPKIHLLKLKTCHWTVSNAPTSLTIVAPNLVSLKLQCVTPWKLHIEAPQLSRFHLALEMFGHLDVKELYSLKTLSIDSSDLCTLMIAFSVGRTATNLILDSHKWSRPHRSTKFTLDMLFIMFPNVSSLTLRPGAWSDLDSCSRPVGCDSRESSSGTGKELKELTAYLLLVDPEMTMSSISYILENCTNLTNMYLLIHRDVTSNVSRKFISRCMAYSPRVRWRWGIWKEGMEDAWISIGTK